MYSITMTDKIYDVETEVLSSEPNGKPSRPSSSKPQIQKPQIQAKLPMIIAGLIVLTILGVVLTITFFVMKLFLKFAVFLIGVGLVYYLGKRLYRFFSGAA